MNSTTLEVIGYAAALLTTSSQFPQAYKIIKSNDTRSISFTMYLMFMVGVATWSVYGVLIGSAPVILANSITLLPVICIFAIKCRNLKRDKSLPR
jgi:MtN3 and saliva related transmembrane protein